jgi:lysophospholipase L1-like esterase
MQYHIFPFEQLRALKQIANPSSGFSDYFHHKKSFFEHHSGHDYDVVFIGDSIIDSAEWQDLFPSLKIANRGINRDTTDGVLHRLESIYSTSAPKAFIMIGVNDLITEISTNEVFDNYKNIVDKLVAHGMEVYIQSTLLVGKSRGKLNKEIIKLNERLQLLAKQTDSVTYIDLNAGLTQNSLLDTKYSRDGLHLNGDGYVRDCK